MYKESIQLEIIQKSEITKTRRCGSVYLGVVVLYMGIHGNTWLYMALHGIHDYTRQYMAIHGYTPTTPKALFA